MNRRRGDAGGEPARTMGMDQQARSRRRPLRWALAILLALPVLLLLAVSVAWQQATNELEVGFRSWLAERRTAGWTATFDGQPERGGWPLSASLRISNLALVYDGADVPGGLDWAAQHVVMTVALLDPDKLRVEASGAQRLRVGATPTILYKTDLLRAVLPLQPGVPPHAVDLMAMGVRAGVGAGGDAKLPVTIDRLAIHAEWKLSAPAGEAALLANLSAQDIGLPMPQRWALGPRVAGFSADVALDGPVPRTPGLRERAGTWRDSGGSLQVQRFETDWGPLRLTGTATLALDQDLQPLGTGTARIGGYGETLDALGSAGAISRSQALAAKAVLALIASAPDDGAGPAAEVPLTLRDRTLSMRQIRLARLPEIVWPPD